MTAPGLDEVLAAGTLNAGSTVLGEDEVRLFGDIARPGDRSPGRARGRQRDGFHSAALTIPLNFPVFVTTTSGWADRSAGGAERGRGDPL